MKVLIGNVEQISFVSKEYTAIAVIYELIKRNIKNLSPVTLKELVQIYGFPYEAVRKILSIFIQAGFVGEIDKDGEKSYVIIKNVETIDYKVIYSILEKSGNRINYDKTFTMEMLSDVVENKKFEFKFKDNIDTKNYE